MIEQIIYAYQEYLLLMGASLESYQKSQDSNLYPPGYETSFASITSTQYSAPQLNIKFPRLQDPAVFALLLSSLISGSSDVSDMSPTEVIDQTDSDDIEPDTQEAVEQLKKEIALFQTVHIDYYQEDLDRIANNQPQKTTLSKARLEELLTSSKEKMRLLKYDLAIVESHSQRGLTDEEEESIRQTAAEKMVRVKEGQKEKAKNCDCSIIPFITKKTFRRNMSDLSADYQGAFSGECWQRTENPKTGKMSLEMKEWLYVGPAGRADFDGWLERFCLLLEMKANYDSLMFSRTEFENIAKTIPKLKSLGKTKVKSFTQQAKRHNKICSAHPYAHCCWIFMTPWAFNAFLDILKANSYPALSAIWVPLP